MSAPRPISPEPGETPRRRPVRRVPEGLLVALAVVLQAAWVFWQHWFESTRHPAGLRGCYDLFAAIDQFQTEYDRQPLPAGTVPGQDGDCGTTAEAGLLAILEGQHPEQNPKGLNFLGDIREASVVKGKPQHGIYRENGKVALYDSWGHPYRVRLDLSGDGFVTDPRPDAPQQQIPGSALVWSTGEDGDFATWHDNVGSWDWGR